MTQQTKQQIADAFRASSDAGERAALAQELSRRNLAEIFSGPGDKGPVRTTAKPAPAAKPAAKIRPEHQAIVDRSVAVAVKRVRGR